MTDPRLNVTMEELHESWSMDDVQDAHAALDFRDWIEWKSMPKPPKKKGGG